MWEISKTITNLEKFRKIQPNKQVPGHLSIFKYPLVHEYGPEFMDWFKINLDEHIYSEDKITPTEIVQYAHWLSNYCNEDIDLTVLAEAIIKVVEKHQTRLKDKKERLRSFNSNRRHLALWKDYDIMKRELPDEPESEIISALAISHNYNEEYVRNLLRKGRPEKIDYPEREFKLRRFYDE